MPKCTHIHWGVVMGKNNAIKAYQRRKRKYALVCFLPRPQKLCIYFIMNFMFSGRRRKQNQCGRPSVSYSTWPSTQMSFQQIGSSCSAYQRRNKSMLSSWALKVVYITYISLWISCFQGREGWRTCVGDQGSQEWAIPCDHQPRWDSRDSGKQVPHARHTRKGKRVSNACF